MKVIFIEHVPNIGKKGEVKEVSSGFASNYLFPSKLAKPYSEIEDKLLTASKKKKEADRRMLLGSRDQILKKIDGERLEFFLPQKNGKPQGGITPKDIAEHISKKYKVPITKKHIVFNDHHSKLTSFGEHGIYVDLGENHALKTKIHILEK